MGVILVAEHFGDFREMVQAGGHQFGCPPDFDLTDILGHGLAGLLPEDAGEVGTVDAEKFRDLMGEKGLITAAVYIADSAGDMVGILVGIEISRHFNQFQKSAVKQL